MFNKNYNTTKIILFKLLYKSEYKKKTNVPN